MQEVTDAEGRRRFHGAFTGGYSAGYYNTVGSLEGWNPSAYTSSREGRTKQRLALLSALTATHLQGARWHGAGDACRSI